jgi:hypothetical protein
MLLRSSFLALLLFCLGPMAAWGAELPAKPVEVMIVGVFHMSNPGHDIHNLKVDDVLEPKRQVEIAALTDALSRFKPSKVRVEWPADLVAER